MMDGGTKCGHATLERRRFKYVRASSYNSYKVRTRSWLILVMIPKTIIC